MFHPLQHSLLLQLFFLPQRPFYYVRVCGCSTSNAMQFFAKAISRPGDEHCDMWAFHSGPFDRQAAIMPPDRSCRSKYSRMKRRL
jgi:hypothetical protein